RVWPLSKLRARPRGISRECLARQRRALILLVSHYDHAGYVFCHPYGLCQFPKLEGPAGIDYLVALGVDVGISFPLYRQHAGLDDSRTRTATMVGVRPFSHLRGLQ